MVMALKGQVRSTHYRQSNLKGESHQKLIVFLRDNRLLSKHISHKHHYPKSFRMRKLFHFLSNDRIGTFAPVPIRSLERHKFFVPRWGYVPGLAWTNSKSWAV
ncbi:hypothetical protein N2L48_004966 [Salmonella enterica]|nr:hypothetical protein [Salmonella enterica]